MHERLHSIGRDLVVKKVKGGQARESRITFDATPDVRQTNVCYFLTTYIQSKIVVQHYYEKNTSTIPWPTHGHYRKVTYIYHILR